MRTNYLLWILVVLFFSACEDVNKKQEIKDNYKTVFATNVKLKDDNQNRIFYATATTTNQIKTSFKVQGNIKKLDLKIGDEVSKNQLISKLDSKPYELKVSQVRYGLSEAKASLKNAQSNYERVKKLYINQNASTSDIDNAKAKLDASKAKVKTYYKNWSMQNFKSHIQNCIHPLMVIFLQNLHKKMKMFKQVCLLF